MKEEEPSLCWLLIGVCERRGVTWPCLFLWVGLAHFIEPSPPAGVPHSLEALDGDLEFVIFGTPPMAMEDERARLRMKGEPSTSHYSMHLPGDRFNDATQLVECRHRRGHIGGGRLCKN
jgi:hypothetical protein